MAASGGGRQTFTMTDYADYGMAAPGGVETLRHLVEGSGGFVEESGGFVEDSGGLVARVVEGTALHSSTVSVPQMSFKCRLNLSQ